MKYQLKRRDFMGEVEADLIGLDDGFLILEKGNSIKAYGEFDYCYCESTGDNSIRINHKFGSFVFGCDDFELRDNCVIVKANGRNVAIIKGVTEAHFNEGNSGTVSNSNANNSTEQH